MPAMQKVTLCLWFDAQAEEAATFYTSIFKHSRIVSVTRYRKIGHEVHGRPAGTVSNARLAQSMNCAKRAFMTVAFELEGQAFTALNGGPVSTFNEAISFQVGCETQEEVDYYWEKLSEGGDVKAQ